MDSSNSRIPSPWCILTRLHTCSHPEPQPPHQSEQWHASHGAVTRHESSVWQLCAPSPRTSPSFTLGTVSGFPLPSHAASLKTAWIHAPERSRESWRTGMLTTLHYQHCRSTLARVRGWHVSPSVSMHVCPLIKCSVQQRHDSFVPSLEIGCDGLFLCVKNP